MSDFYNGGNGGGGGGGGEIDPSSIPDEQNIFLGTNSKFSNGVPDKGWFQHPIAMFQVSGGANRIWLAALRKEYVISDLNKRPPFLINDNSQASKSRYLELSFESYFSSANHQALKRFLLLDIGLLANSDDGKFVKIKKISGNIWDYALDTPSSTPELFEVYIDENNAANNRNVVYNDIVAAINAGKHVYLKTLDSRNEYHFYDLHVYDPNFKSVSFGRSSRSVFQVSIKSYWIDETNSYGSNINTLYINVFKIDESVSPVYISPYFSFASMKDLFNESDFQPVILKYKNSSGNVYKLEAVKLTATEIMFSVYDPDTARNLSIVVNDQDQYTVIT